MDDLAAALRALGDADVAVRRRASGVLEREARKASVSRRKDALGNPTATQAILRALADPDRIVARNAVIALAEISRRYFLDERAYPAVGPLLESPDLLTRLWAANAAVTLRGEASWPDVAPLAQDRSAKVRAAVVRLAAHLAAHSVLSPTVLEQLRAVSEGGAGDADQQVRAYAANLQRHLAAAGAGVDGAARIHSTYRRNGSQETLNGQTKGPRAGGSDRPRPDRARARHIDTTGDDGAGPAAPDDGGVGRSH